MTFERRTVQLLNLRWLALKFLAGSMVFVFSALTLQAQSSPPATELPSDSGVVTAPASSATINSLPESDSQPSATIDTLERLQDLQQQIRQLQSSNSDVSDSTSPDRFQDGLGQNTEGNTIRPFDQLKSDARVQAINQRIDIIKELLAQQKAAAEIARQAIKSAQPLPVSGVESGPAAAASNPADAHGESQTQPANVSLMIPELAPPTTPKENNHHTEVPDANLHLDETETEATSADAESPADGTPLVKGLKVVSSPVNSFELANSLAATGNYAQALKSYELLLTNTSQSIERDWLRCLTANCYRVLGDFRNAEKYYRDVAGSPLKSYPSDHSKWYLEHLIRRKRITAQLEFIDAELQSFFPEEKKP